MYRWYFTLITQPYLDMDDVGHHVMWCGTVDAPSVGEAEYKASSGYKNVVSVRVSRWSGEAVPTQEVGIVKQDKEAMQ